MTLPQPNEILQDVVRGGRAAQHEKRFFLVCSFLEYPVVVVHAAPNTRVHELRRPPSRLLRIGIDSPSMIWRKWNDGRPLSAQCMTNIDHEETREIRVFWERGGILHKPSGVPMTRRARRANSRRRLISRSNPIRRVCANCSRRSNISNDARA